MGPAPVISTSSPSTSKLSAVCTAFPKGSKHARTSSGMCGSAPQTLVIGMQRYSAKAPGRLTPTPCVCGQRCRRPAMQLRQRPQTRCPSPLTRSPGWKPVTLLADLLDAPHELVAHDQGHRDRLLRPGVPVVDVQIGAADAGLQDADQDIVDAGLGDRDLLQPQARFGPALDQGLHRPRHGDPPPAQSMETGRNPQPTRGARLFPPGRPNLAAGGSMAHIQGRVKIEEDRGSKMTVAAGSRHLVLCPWPECNRGVTVRRPGGGADCPGAKELRMTDTAILIPKLHSALHFAGEQVRATVERYPGFYPMYTRGGKWKHEGEAWTHWCDGFFPGMMWLIHRWTGDGWFREQAERYSKPLEPRQNDRDVHDLGFVFMSTYHHWYRLTRDPKLRDVMIQAGKTMGLRFQEQGQVPLLFRRARILFHRHHDERGRSSSTPPGRRRTPLSERWAWNTASRPADSWCGATAPPFTRGSSTWRTGEFLRESTHQGYRGDSSLGPGSDVVALRFRDRVPVHAGPPVPRDGRTERGLLLGRTPRRTACRPTTTTPPPVRTSSRRAARRPSPPPVSWTLRPSRRSRAKSRLYRDTALQILDTLDRRRVSWRCSTPGWEGVLKRGVYHIHKGLGVNESVMWGEYFFVEALAKALDLLGA